jgi:hypothetical protein
MSKKIHNESEEAPPYPAMNQPVVYTEEAQNNNADGNSKGNWLLHRPQSNSKRLIIDFFPDSWCGTPIILSEKDKNVVPPILATRGISNDEWKKWMSKFVDMIQPKTLSICTSLALCASMILAPVCLFYHCSGIYR